MSSFYLDYRYHPCFEADAFSMHSVYYDNFETSEEFVAQLHRALSAAHNVMRELQAEMQRKVDLHWRPIDFDVGVGVLINIKQADRPTLQKQVPPMPYFAGPFKVPKKISENTF